PVRVVPLIRVTVASCGFADIATSGLQVPLPDAAGDVYLLRGVDGIRLIGVLTPCPTGDLHEPADTGWRNRRGITAGLDVVCGAEDAFGKIISLLRVGEEGLKVLRCHLGGRLRSGRKVYVELLGEVFDGLRRRWSSLRPWRSGSSTT